MKHDLCYSKHDGTKTTNEVCDKTMLCELSGIVNPTLRERIDKAIVGKLVFGIKKTIAQLHISGVWNKNRQLHSYI